MTCELPTNVQEAISEIAEKLFSTNKYNIRVSNAAVNGDNFSCLVLRVLISALKYSNKNYSNSNVTTCEE